ncbi:hypothetical protein QAD02_021248 [Eretmocerus hayati]|uniref:Uncharacterized protein n=1 Tax=Eretmocerus hayati TaxID=131215 RepID=A0ACC2PUI4_9HYME|nr:hypothetical protein QAD02_021248 [Eretmocerus hayati]
MDQELKELLRQWNLGQLIGFFEFNNITDMDTFLHLSKDEIQDIIPKGSRCYEAFTEKFISEVCKRQRLSDDSSLSNKENEEAEVVQEDNVAHSLASNDENTIPLGASQDNNLNATSTVHSDRQENPTLSENPVHTRLRLLDTHYTSFQKSRPLFKLLKSTMKGITILYHYAKNKVVWRKHLARIIVDEAMKHTLTHPLNNFTLGIEDFKNMYLDIRQIFPSELNPRAFIEEGETVTSSKGTNKKSSSGALPNAYERLWNMTGGSGLRDVKQSVKKNPSTPVARLTEVDLEIIYKKDDKPDEEKLLKAWLASCPVRISIEYPKLTLEGNQAKFGALHGPVAPKLIGVDAQQRLVLVKFQPDELCQFKDTDTLQKLKTHWPAIAAKTVDIAIALNNVAISTNKPKDVIPIEIDTDKLGKNQNYTCALGFLLLHHLIKYFYNGKKMQRKATKSEVGDSFIQQIEVDCNTDKLKALAIKNRELCSSLGINAHPFIVYNGSLDSMKAGHVVIGDLIYDCATAVDAVDLCFKSFLAFNLDYPLSCVHLWSFLHKYVYELKACGKFTVSPSSITDFVDKLMSAGAFSSVENN